MTQNNQRCHRGNEGSRSRGSRAAVVVVGVSGAIPMLLAGLAYALVDGLVAGIAATAEAGLLFLPVLILSLLFAAHVRDPDSSFAERVWPRMGIISIVLVTVQGLVWITSAPVFGYSRTRSYEAVMRSDLKNLASQQEIFYSDRYSYSTILDSLSFTASYGVSIEVDASVGGWTARATHASAEEESCVIYYGEVVTPKPTLRGAIAELPGEVICEQVPLGNLGLLGDLLLAYYQALERRL